jgi:osmotically-inducible protein OsmY
MKALTMTIGVWCATMFLLLPGFAQGQKITDSRITTAVEDEILFDMAVDLNDIDVKTTEGIVTLTGVVDNIMAQKRAAKLAKTVKGVRSVVNRIKVIPSVFRTDTAILHDVETALLRDPATKSFAIDTAVSNKQVTLTGTVGSWQQKQLAEKVAGNVRGVKAVENEIEIEYKKTRTDAQIEDEVEGALRWDTMVDDGQIQVDVENGFVHLKGFVGSAAERDQAVINAWVMGVDKVEESGLKVRKWARLPMMRKNKYVFKPDAKIRDAIKDALLYDPRVVSFNITPDVQSGIVTLRGVVDNMKAKQSAERVARRTVGVTMVKNRIKVRPERQNDEEVAANVRKAIDRDPFLHNRKITVSVHKGDAYLYGSVDTYFEKGRADLVAAGVYGVTDVHNYLDVDRPRRPMAYDPYLYGNVIYEDEWYDYEPYRTFKNDEQIKKAIRSHLWWSPYVDRADVNIKVNNGTATLKGTVDTWNEWYAALEEGYEGGATWVYNELAVK